jgi:ABC-2 type transport system permease protein
MNQAVQIFKKEIKVYFVSPIAYIVISVFLLLTGTMFFITGFFSNLLVVPPFFIREQATVRDFFSLLPLIFPLVIPAISMRLFAEEVNVGSYEILLTMPVTIRDVVLGKFLAAVTFVAIMLLPTVAYPVTVSFLGDLDWGPVVGGYIGALLLGAAFSAIGIFASSLTRVQIISFIVSMLICFFLSFIDKLLIFMPQALVGFLQQIAAGYHFLNIAKGVLDTRDLIYFLSVCFIGLYAAQLVMEEKQ